MRKLIITCALTALLVGCSQEPRESTPEEKLMSQMFAMLNTATAYDEVCNGSRYIKEPNALLFGNIQMLAARMYETIDNNRPGRTYEEISNQIKYQGQYAVTRAKEVLDRKGCQASESQQFAKALTLFTTTTPGAVYEMIDNQMKKQGIKKASNRKGL